MEKRKTTEMDVFSRETTTFNARTIKITSVYLNSMSHNPLQSSLDLEMTPEAIPKEA
jgi:hypothetical protein